MIDWLHRVLCPVQVAARCRWRCGARGKKCDGTKKGDEVASRAPLFRCSGALPVKAFDSNCQF